MGVYLYNCKSNVAMQWLSRVTAKPSSRTYDREATGSTPGQVTIKWLLLG